jgi:hypothetical protein
MSHFSEVKTKIKNKEFLIKALKQLGHQVEDNNETAVVRGFMGDTQPADFKILTDTHYDIGFKKNTEGYYEVVADWDVLPKLGIEQEAFTNSVKKEYAKTTILETAKEKGLEVSMTENEGQLELVVSKW